MILTPQDKLTAFQKVAAMYIQYILTFHKLEECYDQIVHPQKRRLIRHVLDGTMGRYVYTMFVINILVAMVLITVEPLYTIYSGKFSLVQNFTEWPLRPSEEIFVVLNFTPALQRDHTHRQLINTIACTS